MGDTHYEESALNVGKGPPFSLFLFSTMMDDFPSSSRENLHASERHRISRICSRIKQKKMNYTIPSQSAKGAQKIEKKILTDKIQCRRQLQPSTKRPNPSPSLPLQDPNTGRKRKNT